MAYGTQSRVSKKALIYENRKSPTQSGVYFGKKCWVLEVDRLNARYKDVITGWFSSSDTNNQVKITFSTKEQAIRFAESQNMEYHLSRNKERKIVKKSYSDNFK